LENDPAKAQAREIHSNDLRHVKQTRRASRSTYDRINCNGRRIGCPRRCRRDFKCSGCDNPCRSGNGLHRRYNPGEKVVSALDVNDSKPGKKHLLYFQGVQMPTGQHWYVSVTVAKGAKSGKRVILGSGVHGDEMSSVHTVQTVMNQLDPGEMSGTVMAVTDVSGPALESMQRRWPNSGRGVPPQGQARNCYPHVELPRTLASLHD
jgi:hypothetical protein